METFVFDTYDSYLSFTSETDTCFNLVLNYDVPPYFKSRYFEAISLNKGINQMYKDLFVLMMLDFNFILQDKNVANFRINIIFCLNYNNRYKISVNIKDSFISKCERNYQIFGLETYCIIGKSIFYDKGEYYSFDEKCKDTNLKITKTNYRIKLNNYENVNILTGNRWDLLLINMDKFINVKEVHFTGGKARDKREDIFKCEFNSNIYPNVVIFNIPIPYSKLEFMKKKLPNVPSFLTYDD